MLLLQRKIPELRLRTLLCDRNIIRDLQRKRLSLCDRDKRVSYSRFGNMGRKRYCGYRSSGKHRRIYDRASHSCFGRRDNRTESPNRRYSRKKGRLFAATVEENRFRPKWGGIVRGMPQPGAYVKKNLKIGDIDARAERSHCETISDKARAIGG